MILFNRWIVARVDRAVKLATKDCGVCPPNNTIPGCPVHNPPSTYAAKSLAFGYGVPFPRKRCRVCQHAAHTLDCLAPFDEDMVQFCACTYVENPEYVQ